MNHRTPEQQQATNAKAIKDYAQAREIDSNALQQAIEADTDTPFDPAIYERIHKDYRHWGEAMDGIEYYSTMVMLEQFFTPDCLQFWNEDQLGFALA